MLTKSINSWERWRWRCVNKGKYPLFCYHLARRFNQNAKLEGLVPFLRPIPRSKNIILPSQERNMPYFYRLPRPSTENTQLREENQRLEVSTSPRKSPHQTSNIPPYRALPRPITGFQSLPMHKAQPQPQPPHQNPPFHHSCLHLLSINPSPRKPNLLHQNPHPHTSLSTPPPSLPPSLTPTLTSFDAASQPPSPHQNSDQYI